MSHSNNFYLLKTLVFVIVIISYVSSCTVANKHHVRQGIDPKYQDDDVAFRTTYYFRVFDHCKDKNPKSLPKLDSLYRFRMTGKADTLNTKIHFESGTLKSWELDPLGSTVILDPNTGRFRYQSKTESELQTEQKAAWADYLKLLKQYQQLTSIQNEDGPLQIELLAEDLTTAFNLLGSTSNELFNTNDSELNKQIETVVNAHTKKISAVNDSFHNELKTAVQIQTNTIKAQTLKANHNHFSTTANAWLNQHVQQQRQQLFDNQIKQLSKKTGDKCSLDDQLLGNFSQWVAAFDAAVYQAPTASDLKTALKLPNANEAAITALAKQYVERINPYITKPTTTLAWDHDLLNKIPGILTKLKPDVCENDIASKLAQIKSALIPAVEIAKPLTTASDKNETLFNLAVQMKEVDNNQLLTLTPNLLRTQITEAMEKQISNASAKVKLARVPNSTLLTLQTAIDKNLRIATGQGIGYSPSQYSQKGSEQGGFNALKATTTEINCTKDSQSRGFQILGPQGWATFNPNDRLIMAMHTSAKPLTDTLSELSQRVLNSHDNQKVDLLPLVSARLRVSEARRDIQSHPKPDNQEPTAAAKNLCLLVNKLNKRLNQIDQTNTQDCEEMFK